MKQYGRKMLVISIVVILLLVLHFAAPPRGGRWLDTFYNSLHVPLFGIIAVGILYITPVHWGSRNRLFVTICAVIGFSLLSEVAQIPTGRDASLNDIVSNLLGGIGFVCIAGTFLPGLSVPKGWRRYIILLGISLVTWSVLPLARVSAAYVERVQMLPSLMRFDARFATVFFSLQDAELSVQEDNGRGVASANILLKDGPWPGVVFGEVWPNWKPYTALVIEIDNPGPDALPINVRVHDRDHRGKQLFDDRFNRRIELAPGRQTIHIKLADIEDAPAGRRMDMGNIDELIIFATAQESGRRLVLHDIRLK